ncbi:MAG: sulfatase/phosphatase domain-containing protein [Planctomycetota bacterium]
MICPSGRDSAVLDSWIARGKTAPAAAARARARAYQHRPAEELYDLTQDPWELHNVADEPAYAKVKATLRQRLDAWMAQQGDRGIETELQARQRQRAGRRKKRKKP